MTSLVAAIVVSGGLLWTGIPHPLPALGCAAAFLFVAVESDVRTSRIPNWLTLPSLALALLLAALRAGPAGLGGALLGAGLAFALLWVPYAVGWLGAGDVKALMVLGALWGAATLPGLLVWMVGIGGLLALAALVARGGLLDLVQRWVQSALITLATRRLGYLGPAPGAAAARGIPFGVAIGLGAAAYQLWGAPWA